MICPSCERETAAVSEIGEMGMGKLRKRCSHSDCKATLPEEKPAKLPAAIDPRGVVVQAVLPNLKAVPSASTNGALPSFAQIVAQSEARLLQVRERIAELRSLETEEKQLVLILTAAGKPVPETKPS